MSGAPTWVPVAALGLSLLALVVSAASYRLARTQARLAGPVVTVRWQVKERTTSPTAVLRIQIVVTNKGRGAVTIAQLGLITERGQPDAFHLPIPGHLLGGPELPARLEGNASMQWDWQALASMRLFQRQEESHGRIRQAFVCARLGNDEFARSAGGTYPAWQLARLFPEEPQPAAPAESEG